MDRRASERRTESRPSNLDGLARWVAISNDRDPTPAIFVAEMPTFDRVIFGIDPEARGVREHELSES